MEEDDQSHLRRQSSESDHRNTHFVRPNHERSSSNAQRDSQLSDRTNGHGNNRGRQAPSIGGQECARVGETKIKIEPGLDLNKESGEVKDAKDSAMHDVDLSRVKSEPLSEGYEGCVTVTLNENGTVVGQMLDDQVWIQRTAEEASPSVEVNKERTLSFLIDQRGDVARESESSLASSFMAKSNDDDKKGSHPSASAQHNKTKTGTNFSSHGKIAGESSKENSGKSKENESNAVLKARLADQQTIGQPGRVRSESESSTSMELDEGGDLVIDFNSVRTESESEFFQEDTEIIDCSSIKSEPVEVMDSENSKSDCDASGSKDQKSRGHDDLQEPGDTHSSSKEKNPVANSDAVKMTLSTVLKSRAQKKAADSKKPVTESWSNVTEGSDIARAFTKKSTASLSDLQLQNKNLPDILDNPSKVRVKTFDFGEIVGTGPDAPPRLTWRRSSGPGANTLSSPEAGTHGKGTRSPVGVAPAAKPVRSTGSDIPSAAVKTHVGSKVLQCNRPGTWTFTKTGLTAAGAGQDDAIGQVPTVLSTATKLVSSHNEGSASSSSAQAPGTEFDPRLLSPTVRPSSGRPITQSVFRLTLPVTPPNQAPVSTKAAATGNRVMLMTAAGGATRSTVSPTSTQLVHSSGNATSHSLPSVQTLPVGGKNPTKYKPIIVGPGPGTPSSPIVISSDADDARATVTPTSVLPVTSSTSVTLPGGINGPTKFYAVSGKLILPIPGSSSKVSFAPGSNRGLVGVTNNSVGSTGGTVIDRSRMCKVSKSSDMGKRIFELLQSASNKEKLAGVQIPIPTSTATTPMGYTTLRAPLLQRTSFKPILPKGMPNPNPSTSQQQPRANIMYKFKHSASTGSMELVEMGTDENTTAPDSGVDASSETSKSFIMSTSPFTSESLSEIADVDSADHKDEGESIEGGEKRKKFKTNLRLENRRKRKVPMKVSMKFKHARKQMHIPRREISQEPSDVLHSGELTGQGKSDLKYIVFGDINDVASDQIETLLQVEEGKEEKDAGETTKDCKEETQDGIEMLLKGAEILEDGKTGKDDKVILPKKKHQISKTFVCKICFRVFLWSSSYYAHIRSHTGDKPFKCQDCGKPFSSRSNLNAHRRIHTGQKPFECRHCNRRFKQVGHLQTHIMIHTGEKPYQCPHCSKGFTQSHNLTVHMRVHTGEAPYSCSICGKNFKQKRHCEDHELIHKRRITNKQGAVL